MIIKFDDNPTDLTFFYSNGTFVSSKTSGTWVFHEDKIHINGGTGEMGMGKNTGILYNENDVEIGNITDIRKEEDIKKTQDARYRESLKLFKMPVNH